MTVTYPAWWQGGRWDVERLMDDLFTFTDNPAAENLSGVKVEPFRPPNEEREAWLAQGNAILLVHRNGGPINRQVTPWRDEPIVTLGGLTSSRDRSNEFMSYVTDVLSGFEDGGTVHRSTPHRSGLTTTFMKVPGEVVGPQLNPDQFRDERLTPAIWQLHIDLPHGLPDYREFLGLDH